MHQASLVGIMNLAFVRPELARHISNIAFQQVKLGLKGFAGNKGALAFRFQLWDNSMCFVNVHLPPHRQNFNIRNENLIFVSRSMKFIVGDSALSISEHNHVFWLGDFNYRIETLNSEQLIKLLGKNELSNCLHFDQLNTARKFYSVLPDCKEAEILFGPTFKYLKGSNKHDYKRDPAWCDRILYRAECEVERYDSCESILYSDHKPVFALFNVHLNKPNYEKLNTIVMTIHKDLDQKHVNAIPKIKVSSTTLDFSSLKYKINSNKTLEITNIGNSRVKIDLTHETYIKCIPKSFELLPKELCEISVSVCLDLNLLQELRKNSQNCLKTIKLQLNNLPSEYVIELSLSFTETFIGYSCESLCKSFPSKQDKFIPDALAKLVKFLKSKSIDLKNLSKSKDSCHSLGSIIEIIDQGQEIPEDVCPFEVIHVFCEFLRFMKEPLLDGKLVDCKLNLINFIGLDVIKHQVLNEMKKENSSSLLYLLEYLRTLVNNKPGSEINSKYLTVKVYKAIYQVETLPEAQKHSRLLFLQSLIDR
jgi:endonuclease/exonuclease/phosphatase family metal-dependent hydrolase